MALPIANTLASLTPGEAGIVQGLSLAGREARWLRAVGLFEGQRVELLRRALFGGPLHIRTASGGEFAVDASLAEAVAIERVSAP